MIQNKTLAAVFKMAYFNTHDMVDKFALNYELSNVIDPIVGGISKKETALLKFLASSQYDELKIQIICDLVNDELQLVTRYENSDEFKLKHPNLILMLGEDGFKFQDNRLVFENGVVPMGPMTINEFVKACLDQIDTLLKEHDYSSVIDRAHTSLHGFLKKLCEEGQIDNYIDQSNPNIRDYWGILRRHHPKFKGDEKDKTAPINQLMNMIAKMLDNLNDRRNQQSYAHPNEVILKNEEAKFILNLSRSVMQYIYDKSSGAE